MKENMYRKTPLMGWASWNCFRTNISEAKIREQMDALVSTGLADCGYVYANTDDGFFGGRAADGQLLFHNERFPNGIKVLADYAHQKGLKAGIYSEAGDNTCGFYYDNEGDNGRGTGLFGHEEQDLKMFLEEYGFDFIKVDWCGGLRMGLSEQKQYTKIAEIIEQIRRKTGRCIVYNVCRWEFPGEWATLIADSWRTGADISPVFASVMYQIDNIKGLAGYCSPGHVNDLDMMQIGNGMSIDEEKTHFIMWCIMSAPLMLGCDLTRIDPEILAYIKNRELIAINQDSACLQAYPIREFRMPDGSLTGEIWIKDLGKRTSEEKAVVFLNRSDHQIEMKLDWKDAGMEGEILSVRDPEAGRALECMKSISLMVNPHCARIFKVRSEAASEVADPWESINASEEVRTAAPAEAAELVKNGAVLLDVRSKEEFAAGHLKGAVNLPHYDIPGKAGRMISDKNRAIVIYCASGKRSRQACSSLSYMGYRNLYDLGGMQNCMTAFCQGD